jgi:hypothetical protein
MQAVESAAAWDVDNSLRLTELGLAQNAEVFRQELEPLLKTLQNRVYCIQGDELRSRAWDLFSVQSPATWTWLLQPAPPLAVFLERLEKLASLTASMPPLYRDATMVPMNLPLSRSSRSIAQRPGLVNEQAEKGRTEQQEEEDGEGELEQLEQFLGDVLQPEEAILVCESTPTRLFWLVICRTRSSHRWWVGSDEDVISIKAVIAREGGLSTTQKAVDDYLRVLQSAAARPAEMEARLQEVSEGMCLSEVLAELPAHVTTVAVVPGQLLSVVPLQALPVRKGSAGGEVSDASRVRLRARMD